MRMKISRIHKILCIFPKLIISTFLWNVGKEGEQKTGAAGMLLLTLPSLTPCPLQLLTEEYDSTFFPGDSPQV